MLSVHIDDLNTNSLVLVEINDGGHMARHASKHPTDTELEILQVLWEHGPSSLGAICDAMRSKREVATTTVSTMLKVMAEKGLVRRREVQGKRGAQWTTAVTRKKAARGMVGKLIDRVFEGSTQQLVAHIISERKLSDEDRRLLRELLQEED